MTYGAIGMDVNIGRQVSASTSLHESPSVGSGDDLVLEADAGGNVLERKAGC
jgi:hypothetical protein